jgi:putative salt-induced outer membrane protein YdiY
MCKCLDVRLWAGLLMLAVASGVSADELHLADGSRLVGELVSKHEGKLTFVTSFAGEFMIDSDRVVGISTEQPVILALASGERVSGVLRYDAQAGQSATRTTFGDVPVLLAQVSAIWRPGAEADAAWDPAQTHRLAAERHRHAEELELERQRAQALHDSIEQMKVKWSARLEAGLSGQTGNSERIGFHGRAEARRTTDIDRLLIYMQGRYAKQDGVRSENEIFGGMDLEVDLSDRWFVFGKTYLEYDEFENLDLRARATAGLGYFLIRQEHQELKLRAGVGFQHESYDDGTSENDGVLELGYDYKLEVTPWLLLRHGLSAYPAFDDLLRDYRLEAETSAEVPLGASEWKIRTGMRNQYNSRPAGDAERLDTFYFLNLVMDWK